MSLSTLYFNDLERLLNARYNCDVKIKVGKEPIVKEFQVHSVFLCFRCPYFEKELARARKKDGYYIFRIENISEPVFEIILRYIYTCKTGFPSDYSGSVILELLIASHELELDAFYHYTINYFVDNYMSYIKKNTVKIIRSIYTNDTFDELKNICLEEICANSERLFESTEFESLEQPILRAILERDDFGVDEIKVWENVLRWCLARHPELNGVNVEDWLFQNLFDFALTIKEFVPLIRFQDISNEDFSNKIMPYQMVFPKDSWKNVLNYYINSNRRATSTLLPSRNPIIESVMINRKLTLTFASWIDVVNPPYTSFKDLKYKFELLYRSSRDGLNEDAFHKKCDNISKTLVIARIPRTGQIVGGYNPTTWNGSGLAMIGISGTQKRATNSFIFNIIDRNSIDAALFSYVVNNDHDYAIYCHANRLPTFGRGTDLSFLTNGSIFCSNSVTYNNICIEKKCAYDELEVFQVVDKN